MGTPKSYKSSIYRLFFHYEPTFWIHLGYHKLWKPSYIYIYMWLFSYYRFLKTSFLHQFLSQTAWGNRKTSSRNGRTSVWSGCRRAWSWSAGAVVDRKVQECSVFWCPLSDLGCSISWRMIPTRHKGWKWVILLLSQFTLGSPCIWDVGSNPVLCGCWLWLWGMGQNSTRETDT